MARIGLIVILRLRSYAHTQGGPVPIKDLDSLVSCQPIRAYSKTKLMNILFTRELQRRYDDRFLLLALPLGRPVPT